MLFRYLIDLLFFRERLNMKEKCFKHFLNLGTIIYFAMSCIGDN